MTALGFTDPSGPAAISSSTVPSPTTASRRTNGRASIVRVVPFTVLRTGSAGARAKAATASASTAADGGSSSVPVSTRQTQATMLASMLDVPGATTSAPSSSSPSGSSGPRASTSCGAVHAAVSSTSQYSSSLEQPTGSAGPKARRGSG